MDNLAITAVKPIKSLQLSIHECLKYNESAEQYHIIAIIKSFKIIKKTHNTEFHEVYRQVSYF